MDIGGRFVGYFFAVIGTLMFILAWHLYRTDAQLGAEGKTALGTVIDFKADKVRETRRGRDKFDHYESPVIQFRLDDDQAVQFVAPRGGYPEGLNKGDTVEIVYLPSNPQAAELKSSTRLAFGTVATLILGCACLVPGLFLNLMPALKQHRRKRQLARDHRRKTLIEADVVEVKHLEQAKAGDHFTLQVVARWRDPSTAKVHVYTSAMMRLDPAVYAKVRKLADGELPSVEQLGAQLLGSRLRVRIHPDDPEHYEPELVRIPGIGPMQDRPSKRMRPPG